MIKKFLAIISLLGLFLVSIQSASALQTYVGIHIYNLSDDPASSCVGAYDTSVDPFQQGRIRALSSILPDYPIYYELKNSSGSIISSGNIADGDYGMNETMYLPGTYDLTSGEDYTLFFDVDAIRIYLPLINNPPGLNDNGFSITADNNYWTKGRIGTGSSVAETYHYSSSEGCSYGSGGNPGAAQSSLFLITNERNLTYLNNNCLNDPTNYNCPSNIRGVYFNSALDFKIDNKYTNLYTSSVGNFQFGFTFN